MMKLSYTKKNEQTIEGSSFFIKQTKQVLFNY